MRRVNLESIVEAPDASLVSSLSGSMRGSRVVEDEDGWTSPAAPVLLCGRSKETLQLLKTYQRVVQTNNAGIVFVHAESGMGKTALVESLRGPVCNHGGHFCSGKFFQDTGVQEPYSAVMAAFSDLCDLVGQAEDFDESRRNQIRDTLGSGSHVLSKVITSLSRLLNLDGDDYNQEGGNFDIKNESAFTMFKVACKSFLCGMSAGSKPIVLFLDDIQWMDEGSEQLLAMLLRDCEMKNILLVLAYREEEATRVAPLLNIEDRDNRVVDIHIPNLSISAVHQMVSAFVGSTCQQTRDLSELVDHITSGNPFHVAQFLEAIQREELILFNEGTGSYDFDVERIRSEMRISDNVANLLSLKIALLPSGVRETLKIASFLGYRFESDILSEIVSASMLTRDLSSRSLRLKVCEPLLDASSDTLDTSIMSGRGSQSSASSLAMALELCFIEKTRDGYAFCHDKVQSSFQCMCDESEKEILHRRIGEAYLQRGDPESMYNAAGHLNRAPTLIQSTALQVQLARLNLEAANFCKEKSAFIDAAGFLRRGLELLDLETKWTDHIDLALQLTESLAKINMIIGNLDSCKKLTKEVLLRGKSVDMKINALLLDVEVRMVSIEIDETIACANRALSCLGIKIPSKISVLNILLKLRRVRRLLRRKTYEAFLEMPHMQDTKKATAVRLLFDAGCATKDASNESAYYSLLAVELTIKYGLSPYCAPALVIYGTVEVALGKYARAYRVGELAIKVVEKLICKEVECVTVGMVKSLLSHWCVKNKELVEPFDRTITVGLDTGDVIFAVFSAANSFGLRMILGMNLEALEKYMRFHYQRFCDLNQTRCLLWLQPIVQFVLHLRSRPSEWKDLLTLSGDIMDERDYMKDVIETNHQILVWLVSSVKFQLAYHFGFYAEAAVIREQMDSTGKKAASNYNCPLWHFLGAMTHYELYREGAGKRKSDLKKARTYRRGLQKIMVSPNVAPYLMLIEAEESSMRRPASKEAISATVAAYDCAIDGMVEAGLVHMEGLANERVGFYLARAGDHSRAKEYFSRALHLYKNDWGSDAKFEWLKERSAQAEGDTSNTLVHKVKGGN